MTRRSDQAVPGHYLLRLVKGGPWVAAEIRRDENGIWYAMLDGVESGPAEDPWSLPDLERIHFGGRESYASETAYRLAMARFAREHKPDDPAANPRRPIDPSTFIPF
jgi:hypothetical protein